MASDNEIAEAEAVSWYVARTIDLADRELDFSGLPVQVRANGGVTLTIVEPVADPVDSKYVIKAFNALLSVPGLIKAKLPVEVELRPFSGTVIEVGIRPSTRTLRYPISAERYFDATWTVLDALTELLTAQVPVGAGQAA